MRRWLFHPLGDPSCRALMADFLDEITKFVTQSDWEHCNPIVFLAHKDWKKLKVSSLPEMKSQLLKGTSSLLPASWKKLALDQEFKQ